MKKQLGLREQILHAEDLGTINHCVHAAVGCVHMSRKTRNGIRNAAAKRRKELTK